MRQIVVLNAGSSSLKLALFRGDQKLFRGQIDRIGQGNSALVIKDQNGTKVEERAVSVADHVQGIETIFDWLRERDFTPDAVGHRVVHGGELVTEVARVDESLLSGLERLVPLAPLHQPHNLAPIRELLRRSPDLPQFVGADTAFHRTLPRLERLIPISHPPEVRRYGFHGLSYEFIAGRMAEIHRGAGEGRLIVCHLGSGCSLCGMVGGRSQATTMGFTALEGVPMGARPGSVDPGVILYLLRSTGLSTEALEDLLYYRSGLAALSGGDSDMRDLLRRQDERAADAVDYFCLRIACAIGSIATSIGGVDGIVFTAGIGEGSPEVRENICRRLEWLGAAADDARNRRSEQLISATTSKIPIFVVPTDEEAVIAHGIPESL